MITKEKKREYQRNWLEKLRNNGEYGEYLRKNRERNKRKYQESEEYRERILEVNRNWRKNNKQKWSQSVNKYRKRKRNEKNSI